MHQLYSKTINFIGKNNAFFHILIKLNHLNMVILVKINDNNTVHCI